MNDQERNELRVKVAECARWLVVDCGGNKMCVIRHGDGPVDPLRDLNACHEFERALKPIQRFEYANALETALDLIPEGQGLGLREHRNFAYAHASAEQRCRAFIATMEKGEHHGR